MKVEFEVSGAFCDWFWYWWSFLGWGELKVETV